ncbi:MmcQ/YjbR family DNA-binding protein [Niallia circulans]|uniref:MmcQ/YjbR family DNA-binding protein n=1 Tax=Niallia circulans TaxID=1397 RepID=UPI002041A614|nr:MmcQ/YjbR family DNA-binding protein [Niallia circulans]MCM2982481.1 MmcQ/YjbR family DNA-binding protein [Niallia circulans]
MTTRKEIFSYAKEKYGTNPEYPWKKFQNYAVLRHDNQGKWYGLMMNVPKNKLGLSGEEVVDVLNVKCEHELKNQLRKEEGILPAYHMNKEHWISIVLDSPYPKDDIYNLLDTSYHLTK